ncbi:MAG: hypothetical protein V2I27_01545 [Erythrobacter sp.]|nr:hypothetical protein [Erythrobacter sp.]
MAGIAVLALFAVHGAGEELAGQMIARALVRSVLAWCAILCLLNLAQIRLHRDGP